MGLEVVGQTGGRKLLEGKYDLEAGKLQCNCIRRRWRFCSTIKQLAGGKVMPRLLETNAVGEVEGGKGSWVRQNQLRFITPEWGAGGKIQNQEGEAG